MKKLVVVMFGCLPLFAVAGSGQYHVCTDAEGRKTFTSQPCAANESAEVRTYQRSSGSGGSQRLSTDNPIYQQMKSDNRRADIQRAIDARNKKITTLGASMEAELYHLRRKKSRAANNGAGATWEVSISEEMNAVTRKYTTLIGIERDRLNELNSELAGL